MDETEPRPDDERPAESRVSRRKVLAGGLMFVGGSSMLVESDTVARFDDGESAGGDVQVASLNRTVLDASDGETNTVEYRLSWRVLLDEGFDRVDVTVRNTETGDATVYDDRGRNGAETYTFGYGVDQHEYEFTFEVFVDGQTDPVLTETVVDVPDGTDPSNNDDLSSPDSPGLDEFTVEDTSSDQYGVRYAVSWQLSNADGFDGFVRVTFENADRDDSYAREVLTDTDVANGSVSYQKDGRMGTTYRITVEAVEDSGVVVASGSVTDDPDGNDAVYEG